MENIDLEDIEKLTKLLKNDDETEGFKFKNTLEVLTNKLDVNKIRQIKTDSDGNAYVLFKDKTFYINKELEDIDIDEIYALSTDHIYKITIDNKILPVKSKYDELDNYLCRNNTSYKKIITDTLTLTALTNDKNVIAISAMSRIMCNS